METFDLDKLMRLVDNKFHLVIGLIDRVQLLKRGVEAKVPRKSRDLITVAMEEMEKDLLSFEAKDILTEELIKKHVSDRPAEVAADQARKEALAAQSASLGFGSAIDRRPFATPPPSAPTPRPPAPLPEPAAAEPKKEEEPTKETTE